MKTRTVTVTLTLRTDLPLATLRKRSGWALLLAAWLGHLKRDPDSTEVERVEVEA